GGEGGDKGSETQAPPRMEEGARGEAAGEGPAESQAAPSCDPQGLARADYLKEPGTSTGDFGLTQLNGTVSVPVVSTSRTPKGLVLDSTDAKLPPLTSVYTTAGKFIEGEGVFVGESAECPSGKKYPLQWWILPAGAQKIREGEVE